eukprot:CAMPEP_0184705836 /NCGR_PEP_ID=MMETSP0313-20130426/35700_1 /TAXON_ID=2792 /ORGANISM="Porphyridium aerugineum, Strain SAG 1380-2" /LENGTH=61 /DNA_ID=CAMNT_0027167297 /DNA_START=237 /DNA_END=422 /DNA_ORIENTATION=-
MSIWNPNEDKILEECIRQALNIPDNSFDVMKEGIEYVFDTILARRFSVASADAVAAMAPIS